MDPTNIRELLDAHDKVPTKGEALQFKKSLGTNITLIAQREKTKLFFHNPDITTDLKRVEKALKYILDEEKDVKKSLKREIAKEEYKSMGEDPSKETKKLLGVHGACTEGTQGVFYAIIVFVSLKKAKLTPIMVYKT